MLAGLSAGYRPFILEFQGNKHQLSTQHIKMRLLDRQLGLFEQNSNAFMSNRDNKNKKKHFKKVSNVIHVVVKITRVWIAPPNQEERRRRKLEHHLQLVLRVPKHLFDFQMNPRM